MAPSQPSTRRSPKTRDRRLLRNLDGHGHAAKPTKQDTPVGQDTKKASGQQEYSRSVSLQLDNYALPASEMQVAYDLADKHLSHHPTRSFAQGSPRPTPSSKRPVNTLHDSIGPQVKKQKVTLGLDPSPQHLAKLDPIDEEREPLLSQEQRRAIWAKWDSQILGEGLDLSLPSEEPHELESIEDITPPTSSDPGLEEEKSEHSESVPHAMPPLSLQRTLPDIVSNPPHILDQLLGFTRASASLVPSVALQVAPRIIGPEDLVVRLHGTSNNAPKRTVPARFPLVVPKETIGGQRLNKVNRGGIAKHSAARKVKHTLRHKAKHLRALNIVGKIKMVGQVLAGGMAWGAMMVLAKPTNKRIDGAHPQTQGAISVNPKPVALTAHTSAQTAASESTIIEGLVDYDGSIKTSAALFAANEPVILEIPLNIAKIVTIVKSIFHRPGRPVATKPATTKPATVDPTAAEVTVSNAGAKKHAASKPMSKASTAKDVFRPRALKKKSDTSMMTLATSLAIPRPSLSTVLTGKPTTNDKTIRIGHYGHGLATKSGLPRKPPMLQQIPPVVSHSGGYVSIDALMQQRAHQKRLDFLRPIPGKLTDETGKSFKQSEVLGDDFPLLHTPMDANGHKTPFELVSDKDTQRIADWVSTIDGDAVMKSFCLHQREDHTVELLATVFSRKDLFERGLLMAYFASDLSLEVINYKSAQGTLKNVFPGVPQTSDNTAFADGGSEGITPYAEFEFGGGDDANGTNYYDENSATAVYNDLVGATSYAQFEFGSGDGGYGTFDFCYKNTAAVDDGFFWPTPYTEIGYSGGDGGYGAGDLHYNNTATVDDGFFPTTPHADFGFGGGDASFAPKYFGYNSDAVAGGISGNEGEDDPDTDRKLDQFMSMMKKKLASTRGSGPSFSQNQIARSDNYASDAGTVDSSSLAQGMSQSGITDSTYPDNHLSQAANDQLVAEQDRFVANLMPAESAADAGPLAVLDADDFDDGAGDASAQPSQPAMPVSGIANAQTSNGDSSGGDDGGGNAGAANGGSDDDDDDDDDELQVIGGD